LVFIGLITKGHPMKKLVLVSSLMILGSFAAQANEDSSMAVGIVLGAPTYAAGGATVFIAGATIAGPVFTTADLSGNGFKIVLEAKDDAAAFVGSNGEIVGARLVQAMQVLREKTSGMTSTDMQLAEAILSVK
jgi:uncharacterized protein (TIGR02448 family)